MDTLNIGQKVFFNWRNGLMETKVEAIVGKRYKCFMPMLNSMETFSRDELSDSIYARAEKTAFRIKQ